MATDVALQNQDILEDRKSTKAETVVPNVDTNHTPHTFQTRTWDSFQHMKFCTAVHANNQHPRDYLNSHCSTEFRLYLNLGFPKGWPEALATAQLLVNTCFQCRAKRTVFNGGLRVYLYRSLCSSRLHGFPPSTRKRSRTRRRRRSLPFHVSRNRMTQSDHPCSL